MTASCVSSSVNMNVAEAKSELKRLLSRLRPAELTQLLGWMKNSGKHAARVAWASWVTASAGTPHSVVTMSRCFHSHAHFRSNTQRDASGFYQFVTSSVDADRAAHRLTACCHCQAVISPLLRSVRVCLLADELEDELLGDNGRVLLQSIAEDLRANVAPDAMLPCETAAYSKVLCLN